MVGSVRTTWRARAAGPLAAALVLAGCSVADETAGPAPGPVEQAGLRGTVWDVAAGAPIGPEALIDRLARADVVVLGEVHDNPTHHARQAWLVGALDPAGLAFEMIPEASEQGIAVFREEGGTPGEIGPAIGWDRLGWPRRRNRRCRGDPRRRAGAS